MSSTVMTPLVLFLLFQSSIGRYDSHEDSNGMYDGEEEEDTASVYGSPKSMSPIGLERFLFPTVIQYTRLIESIALDKRSTITSKCSSALLTIADGIRKRKPFAFKCKLSSLFSSFLGLDTKRAKTSRSTFLFPTKKHKRKEECIKSVSVSRNKSLPTCDYIKCLF